MKKFAHLNPNRSASPSTTHADHQSRAASVAASGFFIFIVFSEWCASVLVLRWRGGGPGMVCLWGRLILRLSRCRGGGRRWAPWGWAGSTCRAGSLRPSTATRRTRTSRSPALATDKGKNSCFWLWCIVARMRRAARLDAGLDFMLFDNMQIWDALMFYDEQKTDRTIDHFQFENPIRIIRVLLASFRVDY